ncbi:hypothetical protein OLT21_08520, partial [Campylobacter jejuni]|nr:hypothetical protein [Campylobacter jejuni]
KEVIELLKSLGVSIDELAKRFDVNFYPDLKLSRGVYFQKKILVLIKLSMEILEKLFVMISQILKIMEKVLKILLKIFL